MRLDLFQIAQSTGIYHSIYLWATLSPKPGEGGKSSTPARTGKGSKPEKPGEEAPADESASVS